MKWRELLVGAGLLSDGAVRADPVIRSVVEDSRQAGPGCCFVAMRGQQTDGHLFIPAALQAGAAAIVCEAPPAGLNLPAGVAALQLPTARGAAGRLAAVLYGLDRLQHAGSFQVTGITGTNGKSTFCYLLRAILQAAGHPTALLGTIQYDLLSRQIEANLTTPAAATLIGYLAEAARAGARHAVMEVSSIALDQGRCDGIRFAAGVFSNLTGDHLDYHGDMGNYLQAKKRLFDRLDAEAVAVVNADDVASAQIVADCRASVIWYGIDSSAGATGRNAARLRAVVHEFTAQGTRIDLLFDPGREDRFADGKVTIRTPLVGRHNVQNCLAAAGAAIGLGVPLAQVAAGLESVQVVPGRLQRVPSPIGCGEITVLVDYAHTDDALVNVLSALRPLAKRRLIALFGCGGDRDRKKRPRMAKAAAAWADHIVVTSDNPRTEDPQRIIEEILTGFGPGEAGRVVVEPDRRQAIRQAVAMAEPGDVVLLAGKGHENYQIIGGERIHFDDVEIAAEALGRRQDSNITADGAVVSGRGAA